MAFARSRNVDRVVVGKSRRSRWFELRHGSVVDELVRSGSGLAVEVAPSAEAEQAVVPRTGCATAMTPGPYLEGTMATACGDSGRRAGRPADRAAQRFAGLRGAGVCSPPRAHGLVPSLWVSALSVACFSFFFLPPLDQFTISDPANVMALFLFVVVAIIASALAARTRTQTEIGPP